jgi:hypothetical protein
VDGTGVKNAIDALIKFRGFVIGNNAKMKRKEEELSSGCDAATPGTD